MLLKKSAACHGRATIHGRRFLESILRVRRSFWINIARSLHSKSFFNSIGLLQPSAF